jgi:5'-3' exonuclease
MYGVVPSNYLHYKCFIGDASDNVIGISGFGKKTIFTYFPEMAGSAYLTNDYFIDKANELKEEKKGKWNAYGKFLNQIDKWDLNHKIMSLHEPLIPMNTQTICRNMFDISPNKLNSGKFISLLKEDQIFNFLSMPHVWVRQTWISLQRV